MKHTTLVAILFAVVACSDDDDAAEVSNSMSVDLGAENFESSYVGVTDLGDILVVQAVENSRAFAVTIPDRKGTVSCATAQSGAVNTSLQYRDVGANVRAEALNGRAGSECTIEVTSIGARVTGTFRGTLTLEGGGAPLVVEGRFDVTPSADE